MQGRRGNVIWLAVTDDKYELPLAVADTQKELGNLVGVTDSGIAKLFKSQSRSARRFNGSKYRVIQIEDEQ